MGSSQKFFITIAVLLLGFSFLAVKNTKADLGSDLVPPVISFTSHCNSTISPVPTDATITTSSPGFANGMTLMNCNGGSQNITVQFSDNQSGDTGLQQVYYAIGVGTTGPVTSPAVTPNPTISPSAPLYVFPTIAIDNTVSQYTINAWGQDQAGNWQGTAGTPDYVIAKFTYSIYGVVYVDYVHNGVQDPEDPGYTGGMQVDLKNSAGTVISTTTTDPTGHYTFSNLGTGSYTVVFHVPGSYQATSFTATCNGTNPVNPCIGPATPSDQLTIDPGNPLANLNINFGMTPLYTITGFVWNDTNKDGHYNPPGETVYTTSQINASGATDNTLSVTDQNNNIVDPRLITYPSNGNYTITITSGTYNFNYRPPYGYKSTYPFVNPAYLSIGQSTNPTYSACNTNDFNNNTTCNSPGAGSVSGADFGITNEIPWFQCNGADCREDTGFYDPLPALNPYASNAFPAPANPIANNWANNMPGVIFLGGASRAINGAFGSNTGAQASPNPWNWSAGSTSDPELFQAPHRTSYGYLFGKANGNTTPLDSSCNNSSGCSLDTLHHGLYSSAGDVYLNTTNFTSLGVGGTANLVVLVAGNLHIQGKVKVPVGATATFSVSGDIHVASSVGESDDSRPNALDMSSNNTETFMDVEGFYSADGNFYADGSLAETGTNPCATGTTIDKRLNIAGSIVVNAKGNNGGKFLPDNAGHPTRDLCLDDLNYPPVAIYFRPDFSVNVPEFLKYQNAVWQEVAP